MEIGALVSWIALFITIATIIFSAGVAFGVLRPMQRDLSHLDAKVDALATLPVILQSVGESVSRLESTREEQIKTIVEYRVEILNLKTEVGLHRTAIHDLRGAVGRLGLEDERRREQEGR